MHNYILLKVSILVLMVAGIQACKSRKPATNAKEPAKVSYQNSIKSIITAKCISCHAGPNPAAKINLTTYASVRKQSEEGELLKRINDVQKPMPPGGDLMNENLRTIIANWATDGYLEVGTEDVVIP
ncbi:MAG: putative membrane protein [Bacteroidia bacterium]|jgi:uncharacterized membrane protein